MRLLKLGTLSYQKRGFYSNTVLSIFFAGMNCEVILLKQTRRVILPIKWNDLNRPLQGFKGWVKFVILWVLSAFQRRMWYFTTPKDFFGTDLKSADDEMLLSGTEYILTSLPLGSVLDFDNR